MCDLWNKCLEEVKVLKKTKTRQVAPLKTDPPKTIHQYEEKKCDT